MTTTHNDRGKGCLDHERDRTGTADGGRRSPSRGNRYESGLSGAVS
jgi:hypothetical protein